MSTAKTEGEPVLSLQDSGYRGLVLSKLEEANAQIGDRIKVSLRDREVIGMLMPRAQIGADPDHAVIKMDNGYNVGVRIDAQATVSLIQKAKTGKRPSPKATPNEMPGLPSVAILSTGGTIASRVDYRTGAVNPALTAEDLYNAVPELKEHANVSAKVIMSVLSENIHPQDWTTIARAVASEIKRGVDGVVIPHGTDTLGVTSAAMAFALQELPVPVVLVGSQRSSDRPSSDAALNLIGATEIACRANAAEVMLAMHGEPSDSFILAHRGTHVRKCHTSRRDAFQSVNCSPMFRYDSAGITEISPPISRRDAARKLRLKPDFDDKVAFVKTYPGIAEDVIDMITDAKYHGVIIEGTGLGHAPERIHPSIKRAIEAGVIVAMTSQCIWGRVNMNVYRPGVEMLQMGVIPCEDMLPETALVKLMWLLANKKEVNEVRAGMTQNIVGEIGKRTELSAEVGRKESE
jgi:glutamyl-tRNA(Gln) amidotransferase subunit D